MKKLRKTILIILSIVASTWLINKLTFDFHIICSSTIDRITNSFGWKYAGNKGGYIKDLLNFDGVDLICRNREIIYKDEVIGTVILTYKWNSMHYILVRSYWHGGVGEYVDYCKASVFTIIKD